MELQINARENERAKKERKTRVHFFVKNENLLENLVNRHDRPHQEYRKLLPQVFEQLGMEPQKATWNQKAGCKCGCSPAFILAEDTGKEIYVTI